MNLSIAALATRSPEDLPATSPAAGTSRRDSLPCQQSVSVPVRAPALIGRLLDTDEDKARSAEALRMIVYGCSLERTGALGCSKDQTLQTGRL